MSIEVEGRRDLRDHLVFSIDPPGCTDIDDALHLKVLENGNCEVGVHIADVTHFVKRGSRLDEEAKKRGTTVYLTDRRIDMLPEYLSSDLCSLVSDKDRNTVSVFWEITPSFDIIGVSFSRSVIKSKHSLTYDKAQEILNKRDGSELYVSLKKLNDISKELRKRRLENGALELSSKGTRINDRFEVEFKELVDTNHLVEEFMLLANVTVAQKIFEAHAGCSLLRRHPKFADDSFYELQEYLKGEGIDLRYKTSKELNDSIRNIKEGPLKDLIIKTIVLSMNQALYFASGTLPVSEYYHYGLAQPFYTHFTSPIRRYADIIVHTDCCIQR